MVELYGFDQTWDNLIDHPLAVQVSFATVLAMCFSSYDEVAGELEDVEN